MKVILPPLPEQKRILAILDETFEGKEFLTYSAPTGDSKNTINFLEYLRQQRPETKLCDFSYFPLVVCTVKGV
ncbi:MAG: hypothetical protein RLZZ184_968 [Cyanobacteriota bacterium]